MYQSKHYTCEEIDERLLKGYYDDAVSKGYSDTFEQFQTELASIKDIAQNKESIQSNASAINTNTHAITHEIARAQAAERANAQAIAEEKVAIMGTDRIADSAVTSEKIATSSFDDTLSVSGKIAPADVVGSKLTELEGKTSELEPKNTEEGGFYICDGDGKAIAKFVDDKWEFLGLVAGETIPKKGAETEKYARVTAGTYILGSFPKYLKMGRTVTLSTDVEQFGTIEIGVINTTKRTITIDSTNITLATDGTSRKTVAHGLTISGQLRVTFVSDMLEAKAIIDCNGEQYIFKHTSDSYAYANNLDCSAYGNVGIIVGGSTILNNVVLSASSNYFGKDVWIFGDSYTSIESSARWPNHVLFDFEYKNFMICGLSGGSSAQLYADLEKCLQYGAPKEIIWLLGMNNGDLADAPNPSWLENLEKVEKICRDKGIELVLGTIPCTNQSTNDNSFKNEVIKSRGHRYINFAKAVGAEIKGSSWYTGMKEPDPGIHPSELGAKVLAAQILADCPELTK